MQIMNAQVLIAPTAFVACHDTIPLPVHALFIACTVDHRFYNTTMFPASPHGLKT
jgi:hypothetical protein